MFTVLKETSTRMQIENREVYGLAETIEEAKCGNKIIEVT